MVSISRLVRTAALVALAVLSVVPVFAQRGASLPTGTVKDVNGGVLPGVTVRVTNVTTNASIDAVTNGEGVYRAAPRRSLPAPTASRRRSAASRARRCR